MSDSPPPAPLGPEILRALGSCDARVRRRATGAVGEQVSGGTPSDATDDHRQRFLQLFDMAWREVRTDRVAMLGALVRTMADPDTDPSSVGVTTYAIASEGEDGATELLVLLAHSDFCVRTYAAEGLGALGNRARWAVPALRRLLARSPHPWTAGVVAGALGHIGGEAAITVLQEVGRSLRSAEPAFRELTPVVEGALAAALSQE